MKFKIYTLGCKVNTYESNVMRDKLINSGYNETLEKADIVIINTCSVTNTADKKSIKTVKQAIKNNPNSYVVVTGCSSQNKKDNFLNIDGVDLVLGNIGKSNIVSYIENKDKKEDVKDIKSIAFEPMILNNFNQTRAYVKIQDGCNNFCSYCVIPYVRGNIRSKEVNTVIEEIKQLVDNGHKEIVLTGIHTGHYGADINFKFSDLLKKIVLIPGLERLRISSIEITELTDEVLSVLNDSKILVDHLHIPLQSGCNTVLKRMNRKYDMNYFINKIENIREIRPNISITTDVIVGFPNETEEEFNETLENCEKIAFSKIHVFPYSKRDGTKAALMDGQIADMTKKERVKRLIELSETLENNYFNKFINNNVTIIPEVYKDGYIIGHTGNYLPVKVEGTKEDLNKDIVVHLNKVDYQYILGSKIEKLVNS